ncbi:hypothetical protein OSB04_004242 [Centaurea solstitialis]|uniref:BAT2 N-terminal domain-containing protein n=1 Tax=Centaurea solstitialis TaxID=347529 RepID=A0AA38U8T6_9ASTR|nr:hypothetical protein OSB04_004242 [Centaurea solstitialis]
MVQHDSEESKYNDIRSTALMLNPLYQDETCKQIKEIMKAENDMLQGVLNYFPLQICLNRLRAFFNRIIEINNILLFFCFRWASARRGGMTVLGKVAVPKPLNLPSQKLENHGLDPNVEIVPKGSLSWGSRPSSSTSNPWGSSAVSPNAESSTVSPRHPTGRPSSGGGLSRPSTGGSDRMHEPSASTWGPNSRPSSASGVLTSNQSSLTSSRPLSAETRPGSSHLSRFAEPVFDNSVAWGPNDHGSHGRPGSASGRTGPDKERNDISQADPKSGTVDTWTREGSPRVVDGVHPNAEKWQGEPQHYVNPNVPPQHFDAWRGPPMNAPPGVWYQGPPAGPPYPPVPHGGFPMEPFPYYRPQIPPPLVNSQPGPPPGPGPRGHHPRNGDFYRPQMPPDAFIRPGMPRPGFYPGPVPYDGYFGPPMGYNPNDRDIPFMGMPPGPPVYNMCPSQNPSEINDGHFRPGGRGSVGNMFVPEQPEESRGPYKVLRKRENERDADVEEDSWEQAAGANSLGVEKSNQPRPSSFHRNERGTDVRRNEDIPSRRNTHMENPSSRMLHNQGYPSDSVIVHSPEGTRKSKASNESWGKRSEIAAPSFPEVPQDIPANPKDSSLIQKIEGLNAKVRASDTRGDAASGSLKEEQKNRLLINPKDNSTIVFGSTSNTADLAPPRDINVLRGENTYRSTTASPPFSRQAHHGGRGRADHHIKGRSNNQDNDGWRKKPPVLGFEVPDNHISAEAAENPETKNQASL